MAQRSAALVFLFLCIEAVVPILADHQVHFDSDESQLSLDYDTCLCWNATTDQFCAETNATSHAACHRLLSAGQWYWTVAVALAALSMLFFPCFFALGRCCNCCGGRMPSHGCCCPSSELGRRTYPASTVISAKVIAIILVVILSCFLPWSIVAHSKLADSFAALQADFHNASWVVNQVAETFVAERNASVNAVLRVPAYEHVDVDGYLRDAIDAAESAEEFSNSFGFIVIFPLALGIIVMILGLVGVTGGFITTAAMVFSFLASLYLFAIIAFGLPAHFSHFACSGERFDSSSQFVSETLHLSEFAARVANASQQVEYTFVSRLCVNSRLAALCSTGRYPCSPTLCSSLSLDNADSALMSLGGILAGTLNTTSYSIRQCAANSTCIDTPIASRVVRDYDTHYAAASEFSPSANTLLGHVITGGPVAEIMNTLCVGEHSVSETLRDPTTFSAVTSCVMIFGLIVGLYGAKRFRAGPRDAIEEIDEGQHATQYDPQHEEMHVVPGVPIYGVPIESAGQHQQRHEGQQTPPPSYNTYHHHQRQSDPHTIEVTIDGDNNERSNPTKSVAPF